MKRFIISLATFLTVIGLSLTGFSSDEPTPTIKPEQPETQSHPKKTGKGKKPTASCSVWIISPYRSVNRVFLLDQVTDIELITEKDSDAQHQAYTSMQSYDVDGPRAAIWVMPVKPFFDSWKRGKSLDGISGPDYMLPISKCDTQWSTYPGAEMRLYFLGYPDKAGEYPMTLRMTFAKSDTKEFKFTVKFVSK